MKAVICAELFDGTSVEIRKDWTLLVDQGNVVTSGPFSDVEIPEGADIVDSGSLTVLPGLIDCHDHLAQFTYDMVERMALGESTSKNNIKPWN